MTSASSYYSGGSRSSYSGSRSSYSSGSRSSYSSKPSYSSSSSYYSKPSSYSGSSSYYSKPSGYSGSSGYSYYSGSGSSYYKKPVNYTSGSSYYSMPSYTNYYAGSGYTGYSANYYQNPHYSISYSLHPSGYYFPGSGSYYNAFYGQTYAYSAYGYTGGYYGSGVVVQRNPYCPNGCTVNGFCGTATQCAANAAAGAIVGVIFAAVIGCCICCCLIKCCCGGKNEGNVEEGQPMMQQGNPFEGSFTWNGMSDERGQGLNECMTLNIFNGNVQGDGVDVKGASKVHGDQTDDQIRFNKEPMMDMQRYYEGRFTSPDRIDGNWGYVGQGYTGEFWLEKQ